MKQCANCKAIMADGATFCPKCGTPAAPAVPNTPPAPGVSTTPLSPAPGVPVTPNIATPASPTSTPGSATSPLTNPSSAINGFGAITPNPASPSASANPNPTAPNTSSDPLVASSSAPAIPDSEPITPDTPPAPLKSKKSISSEGLKMPNKRTLILAAIVVVLLIGGVVAAMFLMNQSPSTSNTAETPVAPSADTTTTGATNKALLSGYSFEVPSDHTMELFSDINGSPVLQIASSDKSWVMDLTYLSSTLFSAVSAEGAIDNQIMLLNAQTGSESTSGQATVSDLNLYYIATNYNGTPATIVYATAPAVEGAEPCTFAGIIVSANGESGETVLTPAAKILASAQISTTSPLAEIAEGVDFSGLISILGQGFTPTAETLPTEEVVE